MPDEVRDVALLMADHDDRIARIEHVVAEIAARIGHDGPRPDDPAKAGRWDMPVYWHLSDLRDSLHALRNFMQVLSGEMDQLGRKLDRNASISEENLRKLQHLTEVSANVAESASAYA
jgi:hypothetical protein